MVIRLDKYLCDMQAGTRSAVKDIIRKKKRITINGEVITRPETKVDIDKDVVTIDNNVLGYSNMNTICLINQRELCLLYLIRILRLSLNL